MKNNIGLLLQKRAHLDPELEAVYEVEKDRRFTYGEVNERCNQTANALLDQGVRAGDRVGLLLMNGVEFFESFFAIAKLGAVCVPLNWRLVPDELEFIMSDAGVSALIFGEEFLEAVTELSTRPKLRDEGEGASKIETYFQVGGEAATFALDYTATCGAATTAEPEIGATGDANLYIMYTSGTTGMPKGVVHTHETARWGCLTMLTTSEVRERDRYIVALPLFHVGALTPMTGNVMRGMTNIIMRAFDPSRVWKLIEEERVNCMLAVPAMLNFMTQVPEKDTADRSSLRWIMCGAAPVPVALIQEYSKMEIPVVQVYGMTETCGPACLTNYEDAVSKVGSTGKPFLYTEVRVVNDDGQDVEPGGVGEVWISGPHIMKEYWNRPDATAETIVDGWVKSGDVASIDKDGCVYIQDRKKDMIISGGENVYPAEVENVILALDSVVDVAVIGMPSNKWGESGLAVVVPSDDSVDPQSILDHCQEKLARFKQPVAVEFIDEIPRNPSGKALKRILREQFPGPAAK
jgi:O-succinylbenzoate-CoA ligase